MEKLSKLLSNGLSVARWLAVAVLLVVAMAVSAQTVSISPKTGNVISAVSYSTESHLKGYGGTWVHNQLPLTLVTSDKSELTENGLMSEHANNISPDGTSMVVVSGESSSVHNHMSLSLPKGYRFTSYKMVLSYKNGTECVFKEMDPTFAKANQSVSIKSSTQEATLARTSMTSTDMTNVLYFKQQHSGGNSSYVTIKSFVVTFECTDAFTELLAPGTSATFGTDCVALPFGTQRVDLGEITRQTKNNYTSYKYSYKNVKDLYANFMLYDNSGITCGTAVEGQKGDGHIVSASTNGGKTYMGLANDTYWLEVPTDALSQDGKTLIPVGYRIVGAHLICTAGASSQATPVLGNDIYIKDGNGRYLNASLKYTTTPVVWSTDTDGHVWTTSGNTTYYLTHKKGSLGYRRGDLKTTTSKGDAREYQIDSNGLHWNSDYVGYSTSGVGTYNGTSANITGTTTVSGDASSYTVKLYDKTGTSVAASVSVNAENPNGEVSVDGLNNDAVKFSVEGLADGQTANVALEVQLEALNPYVDKVDVVCRQDDGSSTSLSNQYLADDFTVGAEGKVEFAVPTNMATGKMHFSFDQLHNKKADNTYGPLSENGSARYHFVRSAYYDLIGENLQGHRTEAADYDYTKKVSVAVAGDKAFRCNNSDNYNAGTTGSGTFVYEEYRYANSTYASQGGTWSAIELASGDSRDCYLVTSDETRYNIAPTTTPRHAYYAYYSTNITLKTENYKPELTYTTVYDNAMLSSGFDNNKWVGVTVALRNTVTDALLAKGEGYAYAKQIIDQINTDIANGKTGAPVDAKHILYLDASGINSVLYSADDAALGTIDDLRNVLAANAMVYLPKGVSYKANNVASLSISGDDFVAENNIVLTDKQPFFAPFDIRINAANEVSYTRTVVKDNNTKRWVSLVMPFTMALDSETGVYTQPADGNEFTFYNMNADNSFSPTDERYSVNAHFSPCTGLAETEANKPYLVDIAEYVEASADDNVMFTLRQSGATIAKTPSAVYGSSAQGTVEGSTMALTNRGTYSGEKIAKSQGVFYFNKDLFVSSLNLSDKYNDVYVLPFRTWYDLESTASNAVRYIYISTEENSQATNIAKVASDASDAGFQLSANGGTLTVKATKDVRVSVRGINGQTVGVATLTNGDSRSFSLPSGIYVVNGTKFVVR